MCELGRSALVFCMGNAVKIGTLTAPPAPLATFDPGEYMSGLDFYETDSSISDQDRDDLAQFTHFLAFIALQAKSSKWAASIVPQDSLAYRALDSHFGHLNGWRELSENQGLSFRHLASLLMRCYPPRARKTVGRRTSRCSKQRPHFGLEHGVLIMLLEGQEKPWSGRPT